MKFIYSFLVLSLALVQLSATTMSSATCSAVKYHEMKNELNMDYIYTKYNALTNYAAEAFLANHIYSIDKTRDIGEEFQFGKNRIAKLIIYEADKSGFIAGVYVVNNKRLVIAFAGTGGKEMFSNESAFWLDMKTNLKLLSDRSTDGQIYKTITFIQKMQVKLAHDYSGYDITVTGHSLGGGLAQFASLASKNSIGFKKIKAVTFNTAPMPLTNTTKKWIEDLESQQKWSESNNINFMVNNDPLTIALRYIENREKNEIKMSRTFKFSLGFDTESAYKDLKDFLGIDSYLTKLIYGKRIVLNTNTGHSMLDLIKKVFPNYSILGTFRHGFSDVSISSSLYCHLLTLMEKHVISYPKAERAYKFEPNNNTSIYETSIFIVNAFLYEEYRKSLRSNPGLTKYQYFLNYFNITGSSNKYDAYVFNYLKNKFETIYKYYLKRLKVSDTDVISRFVNKAEAIVFGNQKQGEFTRGQLVSWMVQSMKLDYMKIIKEVKAEIKDDAVLRTGPGSLDYSPAIKSNYFGTGVYQFVQ